MTYGRANDEAQWTQTGRGRGLTECGRTRGFARGRKQYAKVAKLVSNANWEESDIKASIAAISFILTNSAKYNVESDTLATELQQLGLPKGACMLGAPSTQP